MVSEGRPPEPHWGDEWVEADCDAGLRLLPAHDDAYPHRTGRVYASWCAERGVPALAEEYASLPDAARHHGLRVPRDLLVGCLRGAPDYATTTPPVNTVSLRPDRVGEETVDLLTALINDRSGVDRRRTVQPVLIPRRSTRRPTRGSGPVTASTADRS